MAKAAFCFLAVAAAVAIAAAQPTTTLFEVIGSDSDLATLVQAVNASSVINLLIAPDAAPVTVFGPSNEAFNALLSLSNLTLADVAATRNVLDTVLLYHVVDGLYNQSDITDGAKLPTLLPKPAVANSTEDPGFEELTAIVNATGIFLMGAGNTAQVVKTIAAPGVSGIVHVVDQVLQPPEEQLTAAYEADDLANAAAANSTSNVNSTNTTGSGTDTMGTAMGRKLML